MSHLSKVCPACGDDGKTQGSDQNLQQQRRYYLGWRYRLRMISYTAVTLLVAGVILWWSQSGLLGSPRTVASVLMAAGVAGYFITRAALFWVAIKLRKVHKLIHQQ